MSFPWPQWTDRLKELQAAGYSTASISYFLQRESGIPCNRNQVIGALHRNGLRSGGKKSVWTPTLDEALKELWPTALSFREIETKLGISDSAIIKRAIELRLPARGIKPPKPPRAKFNPFRDAGKKPPTPPLTPDQKDYILGQGIPLLKLTPHHCRWPINEPAPWEGYLFCGSPIMGAGCSYCAYHAARAYRPGTPSERRATEAA